MYMYDIGSQILGQHSKSLEFLTMIVEENVNVNNLDCVKV